MLSINNFHNNTFEKCYFQFIKCDKSSDNYNEQNCDKKSSQIPMLCNSDSIDIGFIKHLTEPYVKILYGDTDTLAKRSKMKRIFAINQGMFN